MKRLYAILGLLFFASFALSWAEFRTFTNDFGDSVEAELIELKDGGTIVTIKLRSGRKIDSAVSAFSGKDQKYIRKWWAEIEAAKSLLTEDSRLTISAKMNRKSRSNQYDSWSYVDDETQSFFPEVVISNPDLETFKDNTVHVVVIAKDLHYPEQKLIVSASKKKTDFLDRSKTVLEMDPFRLRIYKYDSNYSSYNYEYGYEYESYIVIIKNSKGEITHTRSPKSKYLENMEMVLQMKSGEIYDEDFKKKLNVSPSSYYVR